MSEIIVLTIGPVQSYIEQARRTQDLWQGSRILSYLASQGIAAARQQQHAQVVYPAIQPGQTENVPNRIVVRWDGDHDGARACAAAMEQGIRNAWQQVSTNTRLYFTEDLSSAAREQVDALWHEQETAWLECYWVVVPGAAGIQAANEAMGSRKLLRNFVHIEERGRKCSITGEHGALHDGDPKQVEAFWRLLRAKQDNLSQLGESERLSAISAIKRFAHEPEGNHPHLKIEHRFPSTSSIAAAPFKNGVLRALHTNGVDREKRDKLKTRLEEFIESILVAFENPGLPQRVRRAEAERLLFFKRDGELNPEYFPGIPEGATSSELAKQFLSTDGDYLFDDTLIVKTIAEYSGRNPGDEDLPGQVRVAKDALQVLTGAAAALGIPKPQPYLVILSMDGDHMGRLLSTLLDTPQHRRFSETLAQFAREDVPKIVEQEHLGRVVYAGGDDVLALLPVREALQVAEQLRTAFAKAIDAANILDIRRKPITAHVSTGLAYVHHTHNLQDAVHEAHDAQKLAKGSYGRNAIGVHFLRRSGERREMGSKWEADGERLSMHMAALSTAFSDELSHNLPYDVAQIVYKMSANRSIVPEPAREAELLRIIRRRLPKEKRSLAPQYMKSVQVLVGLARIWGVAYVQAGKKPPFEEELAHRVTPIPIMRDTAPHALAVFLPPKQAVLAISASRTRRGAETKPENNPYSQDVDALLRLFVGYKCASQQIDPAPRQVDNHLMKEVGRVVGDYWRYLATQWENAQHWLELARFVAQKEQDV